MKPIGRIIIFVSLALLAGVALWTAAFRITGDMREAKAAETLIESTRTHARELSVTADFGAEAFQRVRPTTPFAGQYLGFVSMPSFGVWHATSVSMSASDERARGQVVAFSNAGAAPIQYFTMQKSDFLSVETEVRRLTDQWKGDPKDGLCYDGVPVAFEMKDPSGQVTSGTGNASCGGHYAAVEQAFRPIVQAAGPAWQEAADH